LLFFFPKTRRNKIMVGLSFPQYWRKHVHGLCVFPLLKSTPVCRMCAPLCSPASDHNSSTARLVSERQKRSTLHYMTMKKTCFAVLELNSKKAYRYVWLSCNLSKTRERKSWCMCSQAHGRHHMIFCLREMGIKHSLASGCCTSPKHHRNALTHQKSTMNARCPVSFFPKTH
jgi:hypothetical protein